MQCGACRFDNRHGRAYCADCGAVLQVSCSACGFTNQATEKFCGGCGANIGTAPAPVQGAEPDRRPLTVLFCDLVNSTMLSTVLDSEDLRELIRDYRESAATAIEEFGGFPSSFVGDGIMVLFGFPTAQEDAAERAARAGLGIVKAVQQLNEHLGSSAAGALAVRIGIATGLVVVGDLIGRATAEEDAVIGETPNLAARLQAIAGPNEVIVTSSTKRLLSELFDCEDLGPQTLKGFPEPVRAWRVICPRGTASRFEITHAGGLLPLVGREEELQILQRRWRRAVQGDGQVVLVSGDAGIGKSRLVQELKMEAAKGGYGVVSIRRSPFYRNTHRLSHRQPDPRFGTERGRSLAPIHTYFRRRGGVNGPEGGGNPTLTG